MRLDMLPAASGHNDAWTWSFAFSNSTDGCTFRVSGIGTMGVAFLRQEGSSSAADTQICVFLHTQLRRVGYTVG
jgi:hypothetical protein